MSTLQPPHVAHFHSAREHAAGRKASEVEMQRLIAAHLTTHQERRQAGATTIMEVEHDKHQ